MLNNEALKSLSGSTALAPAVALVTDNGHTMADQKEFAQLAENNYYVAKMPVTDDDGVVHWGVDLVFCHSDTIVGEKAGKKFKMLRFLALAKTHRISQIPGTLFFGPIRISAAKPEPVVVQDPVDEVAVDPVEGIRSL